MKSFKQHIAEAKVHPEDYPVLHEESDEGHAIHHPIFDALKEGHKIQSHKIVHEWSDDHERCLAFHTKIAGKTHKHSQWWISQDHQKLHHQAEVSQKHRDKLAKQWLSDYKTMGGK